MRALLPAGNVVGRSSCGQERPHHFGGSGEHLLDDVAFDVGEAALDAVVLEGEALVVEAEEVEDGGVEIVEGVDVLHGFLAEVIALACADAGLHACAGHPAGEAVGIVVAAFGAFLEEGHAAEFGAPDDEGVFEEAA